jgi:hypothetical protein
VARTMNRKAISISIFVLAALAAAPAHAQVQVFTISPPAAIADPLASGISVSYTLGGSSVLASAQLNFFLSNTRDGSSGVLALFSRQLLLRGSGNGLFLPPTGTQNEFIARSSMTANAISFLQGVVSACQPQSLFILARVDFGNIPPSTPTVMGTVKQPDFLFTGGTLSPTVIQPGGSVNVTFDLFTQCPVTVGSGVGVFLADASFNLLASFGTIAIGTGSGTWHAAFSLGFPTTIPPGNYTIVLIADVNGAVAETNESNNSGAFALTINPSLTASATADDGELSTDIKLPGDVPDALRALETRAPIGSITKL